MSARTPAALTVRDLSVEYPGRPPVRAVEDFSLDVTPGEVVGLLGASGSGKSTVLAAIAGTVPVASGRVVIDGEDVTNVPTHKRGVGLVFQDGQLFGHRSVARNVSFGLEMARWPGADVDARVGELLELVGLAAYGDRDVSTLSGGEAQRIALARSLAPRPRVLLLDEPLSALDAELRVRLGDELARILRAETVTTLMVTHDRAEADRLCDRIVELKDVGPERC